MQRSKTSKYILAGIVSICLLIYVLWAGQVLSDSGIRLKQGITMQDSTNPPPHQTRESIFYFKIENVNDVCNEDVKITKTIFQNDPWADRDGIAASGAAKFLGFKRNPADPYLADLSFELEDEHDATIYFGVETGEDGNGCDFRAFSVRIRICDTGPHGFWDCDDYDSDRPCESPTPLTPEATIEAAAVSQPTGSGTIYGKVINSKGWGIFARVHVRKKLLSCVPGDPDNEQTYDMSHKTDNWPNLGEYSATNLPFGNYEVTARRDGNKQTKNVTVNSSNPSVKVDFTL